MKAELRKKETKVELTKEISKGHKKYKKDKLHYKIGSHTLLGSRIQEEREE